MKCYICDFDIDTDIKTIVACPNCKHNVLTDGTESEDKEDLKNQIKILENKISELNDAIEFLTIKNNRLIADIFKPQEMQENPLKFVTFDGISYTSIDGSCSSRYDDRYEDIDNPFLK